jgi:hypothetical protein
VKLRFSRFIRTAGVLWMLAFLIWLPFEDTATWMALALGATGCAWLWLRWLFSRTQHVGRRRGLAAGALIGAAIPLMVIALMAVKSGLHAHGFGDFTGRQLWSVLSLIPIAAIIGAIVGVLAETSLRKSIY